MLPSTHMIRAILSPLPRVGIAWNRILINIMSDSVFTTFERDFDGSDSIGYIDPGRDRPEQVVLGGPSHGRKRFEGSGAI